MNMYGIIITAAIALLSATASAEPPQKPISNEEAAALLSMPSSTLAASPGPNLCNEIIKNPQGKAERSAEQISCNIDRYGQSLFNVYQQALLHNPKIEGSIVFGLIIEPSGLVISAEPIESTINNDVLIKALSSKFLAMKFPDQKVEKWSGKHTLNFFTGY